MNKSLLLAFYVLVFFSGNLYAQTATDYTTLYTRIYSSCFGNVTSYNLSNLNIDGKFANVTTYPATQPAQKPISLFCSHLERTKDQKSNGLCQYS